METAAKTPTPPNPNALQTTSSDIAAQSLAWAKSNRRVLTGVGASLLGGGIIAAAVYFWISRRRQDQDGIAPETLEMLQARLNRGARAA